MKEAKTWKYLACPLSCENEAAIKRLDKTLREARLLRIIRLEEIAEKACACPQLLKRPEMAGLTYASSSLLPRHAT